MKKVLLLAFLTLSSLSARAQKFVDASLESRLCGGKVRCGQIRVTEPDRRPIPRIEQPRAAEDTLGACGTALPKGQDYHPRLAGTACGQAARSLDRFPMPVDQDKKDKADQILASSNDDLSKRTRAQELLLNPLRWTETLTIPMSETWEYTVIEGSFTGPAESYETVCEMPRTEHWTEKEDIKEHKCTKWETVQEPPPSTGGGYGGGGYQPSRPTAPSGPSPSRPSNSDRLKGTSSGEIEDRSRSNYEKLRQKRDGAFLKLPSHPSREIAQNQVCVRREWVKVGERDVPRSRSIDPIRGACIAQRGTWRTYPVRRTGSRACAPQTVKLNIEFVQDRNWNPSNRDYLDILPNKYDLLPGESEKLIVHANHAQGSRIRPALQIENAWNRYDLEVKPSEISCQLGAKEFEIGIHTVGRLKRRAPNPFKLPDNQEPLIGLDEKGRPKALMLIDMARGLRLDSSMHSRQFTQTPEADATGDSKIGTSEAGGSKAFWVGTQFRMVLYKVDSWGRQFPVTLPNSFNTNATDVFDNEMQISLGGEGGMDRLYRPSGPLQFIFGTLYHHFGVELSPHTNYILEVKAAQREFPFYESTCRSGEVACGDESARESLFSEAIRIPFKTEQTKRSWIKWLKDLQIVIF